MVILHFRSCFSRLYEYHEIFSPIQPLSAMAGAFYVGSDNIVQDTGFTSYTTGVASFFENERLFFSRKYTNKRRSITPIVSIATPLFM